MVQARCNHIDHGDVAFTHARCLEHPTYCCDVERCGNDASFQGVSTRGGKVMALTVNLGYPVGVDAANNIYNVFVVQVYDGLVNLRMGAVDVSE